MIGTEGLPGMNDALGRPASRLTPSADRSDHHVLVDCVRGVLARLDAGDWRVTPSGFWCRVEPVERAFRIQGWKLHLSATPLSAPLVLAVAAEILVRHGCAFKFACSIDRVRELVSRGVDRAGGGKFVTVYPDLADDELRALAEELHLATRGLPGPEILSDRPYRPGSLVHYRFGAFTGVATVNNDGGREAMLTAPDNTLVHDPRRPWYSPPPWAPADPFADAAVASAPATGKRVAKPVLLDGRYVVHAVIRHSYAGGVYRATDQRTDAEVIIKQARRHAGSDVDGRDVRDVRRHEAAMLAAFADTGRTPRVVAVFEQQGDVFLVEDTVPGVPLRRWVAGRIRLADDPHWGLRPAEVHRVATGLVELIELVHDRGVVLRDFNPNNVMVDDDLNLWLIDLELVARPGELVTCGLTPGYGAPELMRAPVVGPAPEPSVDLYSLGTTLFYLVTGIDPVLPPDGPEQRGYGERLVEWLGALAYGNEAALAYAPIISDLLSDDPDRRPRLAEVRAALASIARAAPTTARATERAPVLEDAELKRMITDGVGHLVAVMAPDNRDRLWPGGRSAGTTDPCNVQHGAGGVLAVLARAYATGPEPALGEAVHTAARWIRRRLSNEVRVLPGLYFGRSGTAWALLDAGRVLDDDQLVRYAEGLARRVPVRWPNPDICHGISGAGMTQLRFWEGTGQDEFLRRARDAADAVTEAVERRDGAVRWPIPRTFASDLAGLSHYGFAHGVAGCGAFLLSIGRATGDHRYLDLAVEAADALVAVARIDDGAAYWPTGDDSDVPKVNWCSGSSGVGTFLAQAWRTTGDNRLLDLCRQAALAVHRSRRHSGTCQCHGLAGDGEFLLDLAEVSGEQGYRDWAADLAASIFPRYALCDGRMVAPDESRSTVAADFGTGLAGVLAFLVRLREGGRRMWLPEAFTGSPVAGEFVGWPPSRATAAGDEPAGGEARALRETARQSL